MNNKSDALLRQWMILKHIPVFPKRITATELTKRVKDSGFDISKRTMERNLQILSRIFPLHADERSRPYGWSWNKDADTFALPAMSPVQALTLSLARDHLTALLPSSLMETLNPYFRCADSILLSGDSIKNMADWRDKVAVVPSNQALIPPQYDEGIVEIIHAALLSEKKLEIDYASRSTDGVTTRTIHPLGLVQRGAVIYLVASMYSHDDIRILALHRIRSARKLDESAIVPEGFCLGQYIAKGAFGFAASEETIPLVARFTAQAAEHLRETPLSEDQQFIEEGHTVCIKATVSDSPQLRWWLKAFCERVEVLEPASLRQEFAEAAKAMGAVYK